MKTGIHFITFSCLLMFIFGYQNVDAQQNLAQEAYAIFEQSCLICHGENGSYTEALIIEHTALIDDGKVVPGNPDGSVFYQRLIETNVAKRMPLGQPPLDPEAIETIRQWIAAGTPDWSDIPRPDTGFITTDAMLETIENHVKTLSARDKTFARYFSLTHLYNAGETTEALQAYRRALSKLINSLSWGREVVKPQPINVEETLFYVDLRDYEWDVRNDAWTQIEQVYPYKMTFDTQTQTHLHQKLTILQQEMSCEVPFVHVDWFLATASLPPLYHNILALPQTDRELEVELDVYVTENLQNAPGKRVWRAGFNDSGVSRNNRVVERHTSSYGAYWKSYDFAGSAESQNIFTHPLDFTHDGGEIIFNLPNGLQAYYLVDAGGGRLDVAPTSIVSNPAASDPAVRNGLSCIGCHTQGMKTVEDEVRAVVDQADNPPFDKVRALDLYVEKTVMDELVKEDTQRYRDALEAAGGVFGGIEPIQRFHEAFQGTLDAAHAAAAVGLETETFLEKISKNVSLQNLGLQVLTGVNGTVKRDAWTSNFHEVIAALDSPDSILPPVEQRPERIPGASVYIPDTNLRAAIAEALGKAAGDVITVEDMETLTSLDAIDKDISDLTGLEYAINLEDLKLHDNLITDISPLENLIALENLQLNRNPITDISPINTMTKLRTLGVKDLPITDISPFKTLTVLEKLLLSGTKMWDISDISPLAALKNLKHLELDDSRMSDISPLASLHNLEVLYITQNTLEDLSPLASLHNLKDLRLGVNGISDISPLKNLTNLESLNLWANRVVDISPLSTLRNLERLYIPDNKISDISALASLHNLKVIFGRYNKISNISPLSALQNLEILSLPQNEISDVSPLASLQNLEILDLHDNKISDVSPLASLKNLEKLTLQNNLISDFSPVEGLPALVSLVRSGNPGAPPSGPKIEGPWLWVIVPGTRLDDSTDFLAEASNGKTTEVKVVTHGAKEGKAVGDSKWTSHTISPTGFNNINDMTAELGWGTGQEIYNHIIYGSIILYSPLEQNTHMLIGSGDGVKVWLNEELVYQDFSPTFDHSGDRDYRDFFPVTLNQGANFLLVAVDNRGHGAFSGFWGFEKGTEYTLISPGVGFTFSATETTLLTSDTFTLNLNAENITDLAGWQADIAFDPNVLEAIEVTEGDFLKSEGDDTFFQGGTIDNIAGKITSIFAVRQSASGASGTGTLLSVTFMAKAGGETQVTLENFEFISITDDIILTVPPNISITVGEYPAWDVNQDGRVSIRDLILVAKDLGSGAPANLRTDVNRDGEINIQDLILVARHIGESTDSSAAPTIFAIDSEELMPEMIETWIEQAQTADDGSLVFRQGIENLKRLLASLIPEKTALLANYPNPFNPETWIPYHLAKPADVTLTIYAANGAVVRTIALGHQVAGMYQSRSRAVYWDGRNAVGEPVASSIYFYTLTAGDYTATRKMLIIK